MRESVSGPGPQSRHTAPSHDHSEGSQVQGPPGQIPGKGGIQVQWAQVRWEGTHLELLEEGKCRPDVGRAGWAPGFPVTCSPGP